MRLVYIDEAGISHPEPVITVAAIVINADKQLVAVERHLDKIVRRWIPPEHWNTFVFHATHLFNWGGPVFTRNNPNWSLQKRLSIADELAAIPKKFGLPLMVSYAKAAEFPSDPELAPKLTDKRKTAIAAHTSVFGACAVKVEHWMRYDTDKEIWSLIVENNDQARQYIRGFKSYGIIPLTQVSYRA